jgi:hemolysin III
MPAPEIYPLVLRNPVSSLTHLFWCLWAIPITLLMWRLARGDRIRQLSVGCFGLCMIVLYGASGIYHAIPAWAPRLMYYSRLIDHSAIYLLIAGTYTPVFAVLLRGRLRMALLRLVWGLALLGIACKWLFPMPGYSLTVALYIALGWVGLIPMAALVRAIGVRGMAWGIVGGILYTAGGICDAIQWPILIPGVLGYHEMLHLLDMAATLVHVVFIIRYVIPASSLATPVYPVLTGPPSRRVPRRRPSQGAREAAQLTGGGQKG